MELDQMIGERVGWWRMKQSIRLAKKARKLLDDEGLEPKQVPLRTSVPLLEAASLEEDDALIDRWAALLANATAQTLEVPPSFASVLREIEPEAARVLDRVYEVHMRLAPNLRADYWVDVESFAEFGLDRERFAYHVDNLLRLGVVRHAAVVTGTDSLYARVGLTAFGRSFIRACQPPGTPEPPVVWTDREKLDAHITERKARQAEEAAQRATEGLRSDPGSSEAPV